MEQLLRDIANNSCRKEIKNCGPGLLSGKAGIALFLFYYSRLSGNKHYANHATKLIVDVFNAIKNGFNFPSFSDGISGYSWSIEHLIKNDFIKRRDVPFLDDLDQVIHQQMMQQIKNGNWDFLHGSLGSGIYFLERLHIEKNIDYLEELLFELEKKSERNTIGHVYWGTVSDIKKDFFEYNLGLAHGLPSIIIFLSKLIEIDRISLKAKELLDGAIKFLLQQRLDFDKHKMNFPNIVYNDNSYKINGRRLGWCYGDLTIGVALYQAAIATFDDNLKNVAVEIILKTTEFRDKVEEEITTPLFCHGTVGIAHIYNRMYLLTKIEKFRIMSQYWFKETLEMPLLINSTKDLSKWQKDEDILEEFGVLGMSGIGLAFISSISPESANWDRCLLLS